MSDSVIGTIVDLGDSNIIDWPATDIGVESSSEQHSSAAEGDFDHISSSPFPPDSLLLTRVAGF